MSSEKWLLFCDLNLVIANYIGAGALPCYELFPWNIYTVSDWLNFTFVSVGEAVVYNNKIDSHQHQSG